MTLEVARACELARFPIARAPQVGSPGGHDRLARRGREKEAVDFPAIHSRESRP